MTFNYCLNELQLRCCIGSKSAFEHRGVMVPNNYKLLNMYLDKNVIQNPIYSN